MNNLLTLDDTAARLAISVPTLRRWIKAGLIPCLYLGPQRSVRFEPDRIDKFIEESKS